MTDYGAVLNAAPVACLFQKYSDVFAKGYANL